MEIGIIVYFKVGYCVQLLEYILWLFDEGVEGYEALEAHRENSPRVCKGMCVRRKPTMLDLMDLSAEVWNDDAKYAYKNHAKLLD